ncbi:hypothetical protein Bca52824_087828 [Brassica carinata]|uniref:Uncharacterized protein n=1 Tax=Brassica carinata TaxID=52824 RepID=A0A8X7PBF7_BRACI|nr:hypothetical protein Bca52824_087828 [Brassica carinata]
MGIWDISVPYSTISQGLMKYEEYVEIHSRTWESPWAANSWFLAKPGFCMCLTNKPTAFTQSFKRGFETKEENGCVVLSKSGNHLILIDKWFFYREVGDEKSILELEERRLQCTASLSSRKRTSRSPKSGKYTLSTKERCGTRVWRKYIDDLKDPGPSGKSYSLSGIYGCCQEQKRNA